MLAEEDVDASACPNKKPLRSHVACTLQASHPRCDDCQVVHPCLLQSCQLAGAPSASSADLLAWHIWATPTARNSKPALTLCVARLLSMIWRNICWWKRSLHISRRCCVQRGLSSCLYWQMWSMVCSYLLDVLVGEELYVLNLVCCTVMRVSKVRQSTQDSLSALQCKPEKTTCSCTCADGGMGSPSCVGRSSLPTHITAAALFSVMVG